MAHTTSRNNLLPQTYPSYNALLIQTFLQREKGRRLMVIRSGENYTKNLHFQMITALFMKIIGYW